MSSKRENMLYAVKAPQKKVDLHQNLLTNSLGESVAVYDLDTKTQTEIKCVGQQTGHTRRFKDTLYINTSAGIELYSIHDYVRQHTTTFPFMVKTHFLPVAKFRSLKTFLARR